LSPATLIEMEWPDDLLWTDLNARTGEVFRIGRDVGIRDGDRVLRIEAVSTPDASHRLAAVAAVRALSDQWGGPVELVLDFVGHGPPGPGESLQLCRELVASGSLERIALIKKSWMPGFVVSGVVRALSGVGVPITLVEPA
jgi:hypothetical protein